MKYKSKKAISIVTTLMMTASMANPLMVIAADKIPVENKITAASEVENSKCNLASLSVTGLELSPEFKPDVLNYTIPELAYNKSSITVKAVAQTEDSTVKITYTNAAGKEMTASSSGSVTNLRYGKTVITIAVTSADESETKAYTITAIKKSALSNLNLSIDGKECDITPSFKNTEYDYSATTIKSAKKALIKATPALKSDFNTIKIGDKVLTDEGLEVALDKDETVIPVVISGAEDLGKTTYNLTISKVDEATIKVNTNVEATVRLIDYKGRDISGNGTYSGLLAGQTYKVVATKYGYVVATKDVTAAPGEQSVDLELVKALDNSLQLVSSYWKNFRGNDENMGITTAKTPRSSKESAIKWSKKLGTGWTAAPSVQIEVDDSIVVLVNKKIYKLDKENGDVLAENDMVAAINYGYTPPTYAEGMIFAPLANGTIQAFNAKTLESLWVSESVGGQALSPITYDNGYIYTGFWNGEIKNGDFVCISTTDEDTTKGDEAKYVSWKFTALGGFYWAGAYAKGDTIIVGSDDGESGFKGTGHVYSLNKTTGAVIDKFDVIGDQRSSMAYDKETGKIFFTTKAGYLYSVKVKADGTFDKNSICKSEQSGQSTATPLVYKGRVYYGSGVLNATGGKLIVADANTLEKIYEVPLKAYPQASVLLSTAYEKTEGKVYIYSTYNASPGGITVIKDSKGQTEPVYEELIELPKELQQYCISSPICDSDGTIYYKNDSGNVIAIKNTNDNINITFNADNGSEEVVKEVTKNQVLDYAPETPVKEGYVFVGWYKDVDNIKTAYENNATYTEDVTYTAKWAHVKMLGAQAKIPNKDEISGIRFVTEVFKDGDSIERKGTLIIPENKLKGEALVLENEIAANSECKYNYMTSTNKDVYLGTLVGIPESQHGRKITAAAYVVYEDKAGNEYTVYSPYVGENGQASISVNDFK